MLCFVICEIGFKNRNILLCKNILNHKATVSVCLKGGSTSLNTEANSFTSQNANTSFTEVDTNAETPFSTTNANAGMYHNMA